MQKWFLKIKVLFPTTRKRELEFTVRPWAVKFLIALIAVFLGGSGVAIFRYATFELNVNALKHLKNENSNLKREIAKLKSETAKINEKLSQLVEANNRLRLAAGLDPVPKEILLMGMGGNLEELPSESKNDLKFVKSEVDRLLNLAQFQLESFSTVAKKLEEDSKIREHTPSILPTAGYFTSGFGMRRDPFTGQMAFHEGIDIAAPIGTPVIAPANGIVVSSRWDQGYGLVIEIDHGLGIKTRYAHLQRAKVTPGQYVKRGEIIGYVGNTGRSTAPHLHYEVRVGDNPVNPVKYIIPTGMYYD